MRKLAVSIMLAVACLLVDATETRLIADPEVDVVQVGVLFADTSCPAATYKLVDCPYYSTAPSAYLAIERQKGKPKNLENTWVLVIGVEDAVTCAPTRLIRVRSIERSPIIPLCP